MHDETYMEEEAARVFVRMVAEQRSGSVDSIRSILEDYGSQPGPHSRLHEWYRGLDEVGRQQAMELAQESVDIALNSLMSFLAEWSPLVGMENTPIDQFYISKFAIYLQAYVDRDAFKADRPSYRSKNVNGHPDPLDLYEKYVEAVVRADEDTGGV